ncbi:MAG: vitamin B12 dependent-methionine synthase activation domain-containing protein [Candidatus Kryptoniota bacterium]
MCIETFSFRQKELKLSQNAFACVLGYAADAIPSPLAESIDDALQHGSELCQINGGYKIIDSIDFDRNDYTVRVGSRSFDIKKTVFQQLKNAKSIAAFVCTAGDEIVDRSRQLMKEGELLKGYVYDVFGSLVVEEAMDIIQESLRNKMQESGLNITNRYSPGYCGWDVSEQKKLFSLLPDKFCGIELTDSCLMRPIKSVSGIIGVGKSVKFNQYTCNLCDASECLYRNLRHENMELK